MLFIILDKKYDFKNLKDNIKKEIKDCFGELNTS